MCCVCSVKSSYFIISLFILIFDLLSCVLLVVDVIDRVVCILFGSPCLFFFRSRLSS